MGDVSDYSIQIHSPASSSGVSGLGLPTAPPALHSASGPNSVAPSPNQVRRSKRQPMTDLSASSSTPSPVSMPLSTSSQRSVHDSEDPLLQTVKQQQLLQPTPPIGSSSPTQAVRSPRMGRKTSASRPVYQQQQHSPPLYENHTLFYPELENLSLNESPRYPTSVSRSEPPSYSTPQLQTEQELNETSQKQITVLLI